jgi:hypothetical protein
LDALKYADRIEALRGQDRDVMHARILAFLSLGRLDEAKELHEAGNFRAADISEAMSLLVLQIPAAVFGDRTTANRAAAEIDAMTLLSVDRLDWSEVAAQPSRTAAPSAPPFLSCQKCQWVTWSRFMTLVHAATKSCTNFSRPSFAA